MLVLGYANKIDISQPDTLDEFTIDDGMNDVQGGPHGGLKHLKGIVRARMERDEVGGEHNPGLTLAILELEPVCTSKRGALWGQSNLLQFPAVEAWIAQMAKFLLDRRDEGLNRHYGGNLNLANDIHEGSLCQF
jgi:hypothetical protein